MLTDNAKKKTQIAELQSFVSRFSANASKARQATSRARQIEKIKLEDVKPSTGSIPISALTWTSGKSCTPCGIGGKASTSSSPAWKSRYFTNSASM